jgi:pimeloyl-ACP methyl ester carboxylesterase
MKNFILIFILAATLSCQSLTKFFDRSPSSETAEKAKHYIFTVHGLAGNATTFTDLLPVIKTHLEYVDSKYEVIGEAFTYNTGNMAADVPQFIESFEQFLDNFFKLHSLNANDKISIVCHSQGGLVTTLWYAKSLAGEDKRQLEISSHVRTIVTEGTPFWGSKMAHIINDRLPFQWMQSLVYDVMAVGKMEVRDMSTASTKIFDFFRDKASAKVEYLNTPHMLNIAGLAHNPLQSPLFNVGKRWEADQVVNVPSTRLGFYFYSDTINLAINQKFANDIDTKDFTYSQYFSRDPVFRLMETIHTKTKKTKHGMAQVPAYCVNPEACDQVTYPPVFAHLSRCEEKINSCDREKYELIRAKLYKGDESFGLNEHKKLMKDMQSFQLGFNLQLPKGFSLPKDVTTREGISKYLKIDYLHGNTEKLNLKADRHEDALIKRQYPFQDYRIQVGRHKEWGSRVAKHFQNSDQLNVQFSGLVKPTDPYWKILETNEPEGWNEKTFPVTVTVDIPGLKKRVVTVPVRPTYSTFVDLILTND